jgi:hypothetical protein
LRSTFDAMWETLAEKCACRARYRELCTMP